MHFIKLDAAHYTLNNHDIHIAVHNYATPVHTHGLPYNIQQSEDSLINSSTCISSSRQQISNQKQFVVMYAVKLTPNKSVRIESRIKLIPQPLRISWLGVYVTTYEIVKVCKFELFILILFAAKAIASIHSHKLKNIKRLKVLTLISSMNPIGSLTWLYLRTRAHAPILILFEMEWNQCNIIEA